LRDNTEWNIIFNKAMSSMDRHTELTSVYDFSNAKCVLDVGGGNGILIMHLLRQQPHLTGILYDLPHVIDDARKLFTATESDILKRLNIVAGDMFVSVPTGADTVILSHVLMSFDNSKVKLLLNNCRTAMTTGAKLLIIEVILRNNTSQPAGRLNDLNMLVLLGGRHQNEQEYLTLLKESNFIVESNIQMKCDENILVCRAI
jgi:SAM-dependent methyltransferase